MHRCLFTLLAVAFCAAGAPAQQPGPDKTGKARRSLPGIEPGGLVRLHNQWAIRPAGKQLTLGDFPVNTVLHPSGKWLAALHAGYGDHEIIIVDLDAKKQRIVSRVLVEQTFNGLAFSGDGKSLFAGGGEFDLVHVFDFADGYLSRPRQLPVADKKFIPSGIAHDARREYLYVTGAWGHGVCFRPLDPKGAPFILSLGEDSYPYTCL